MEQAILQFMDKLEASKVPMHALLLWHNGQMLCEGYYAPFKKGDLHRMFSICKSLNALAIGILEEEGKLSLQDPIIKYFPEKLPEQVHPFLASMTIENMLMMRSCHASTTYKYNGDVEWVESFFTTPPSHKPGTVFHYDTSAAHVLCMLVEKLSGKPMIDFLKERVLNEIGWSEDSYMLQNEFGDPQGGSGLMCTPMDLLLLGRLLMNQGSWNGKQLLPAEYVKKATSNLTPNLPTGGVLSEQQGYGYQIWVGEKDNFVLYGMGGQLCICFPKHNFICVTCADSQEYNGGNQFIYNALYETILPKLEKGISLGGLTKTVSDRCDALALAPIATSFRVGTVLDKIDGKTYRIATMNKPGFSDFRFDFAGNSNEGTLTYHYSGKECKLSFGLTFCVEGSFPVYNQRCATSAAFLEANTLYLKSHIIDTNVGCVSMEFVFGTTVDGKEDVTIFLKKKEETMFKEYEGHLYGVCAE